MLVTAIICVMRMLYNVRAIFEHTTKWRAPLFYITYCSPSYYCLLLSPLSTVVAGRLSRESYPVQVSLLSIVLNSSRCAHSPASQIGCAK